MTLTVTFILKIAPFVSQVILGHNFWTISDRNFFWHAHSTYKTFSDDIKVNTIWPWNVTFILKIAQFMSKIICDKTKDIGYIYIFKA